VVSSCAKTNPNKKDDTTRARKLVGVWSTGWKGKYLHRPKTKTTMIDRPNTIKNSFVNFKKSSYHFLTTRRCQVNRRTKQRTENSALPFESVGQGDEDVVVDLDITVPFGRRDC